MAKRTKTIGWRKGAKLIKKLGMGSNNSPLARAARGRHTRGYI